MLRQIGRNRPGVFGGLIAYLIFIVAQFALPMDWLAVLRERAFDAVLAADLHFRGPQESPPGVLVVDIDRRTLAAIGSWPWPRAAMAQLVQSVAAEEPKVVAIDVLFASSDLRSVAAGARQSDVLAPAPSAKTDGDRQLAVAVAAVQTVLGSTLDTGSEQAPPMVRVLRRGPVSLNEIWRASGAGEPAAAFLQAAAGNGILSLPGDPDGKVRRVPLLVAIGEELRPGLAVEAVRVAQGASNLIVEADPQRLLVGVKESRLQNDGFLRLAPVDFGRYAQRTISAIDVIQNRDSRALADKIVLIGTSAPEIGGLRETPDDALTPSVQIEANAIEQILLQRVPTAAPAAVQIMVELILGCVALAVAVAVTPVVGVVALLGATIAAWIGAVELSLSLDRLLDPLTPSIGAVATFVTASLGSFITVGRREARIRNRFAQHLAPEVVKRIAENPEMLKLRAEKRELTALFTDIEGFTTMTHHAGPEQLVAELDGYIEGVASIVMRHGGMVDKIVGDAVHAFFNAPIDLPDHAVRSIACAIEIRGWTEQYRLRPTARSINFGRTRIGIETGEAVVGDIGIRSKLDYTAHGDAINSAARLEAINKELGSSICIGPVAAGRCDPSALRPLGNVTLRGLESPIAVFEPWPPEAPADWRARYLAAIALICSDPAGAAALFDDLAAEMPCDAVPSYRARQLRSHAATS